MSVVGFDLGNESCIVAVARQRGIDVVLNDESKRETPAIVCFGDKQRFIGTAGAASSTMNPKNSISQIKRLIGRKYSDPELQSDLASFPYRVSEGPDGFPLVHALYLGEERVFTPTQLLAMVLSNLKAIAESNLNSAVVDCCIGIPVYFTDLQRRAVHDAATIAGLRPLRLFHETTATAMAYGIYKTDLPENDQLNVAFVDVGHASMQVCIAGFKKGQLKVLSHTYDRSLGGRDFDEVLFKHFAAKFKEEYKIDVYQNARACIRLRVACEKLKKMLSANPEAPMNIECLMDEKDVRGFIKRDEFEQISASILERVKGPLEKALAEAGLTTENVHFVEVVGSGSRVPAVIKILTEFFGKEPRRTMNASECVARGCALECAILSPTFKVREFQVNDGFPFSIAMSWKPDSQNGDNQQTVVFPKGNPMPSIKALTFYRSNTFAVDVTYVDAGDFQIPPNISTYTIGPFQPNKGEKAKLKLKVRLNIHGIVSVESATMLEEEEVEVPVAATNEPPKDSTKMETDEAPSESASGTDVKMQEAKASADSAGEGAENGAPNSEEKSVPMETDAKVEPSKKKVKKTNVPIAEFVYGALGAKELEKAMEKEFEMALQDRVMEETKDKKNAVEAYVYDIRNKLYEKYNDFVTAEEKEAFIAKLQEVEDWLYEDGEDETKGVYVAKLEELKKVGDPIEARYKEWVDRGPAIDQLVYCINSFREAALSKDPKFDHIDIEEKQKVINECLEAEAWLREKKQQQDALAKHANPVLLSSDIKKKAETLDRFCKPIMTKPKLSTGDELPRESKSSEASSSWSSLEHDVHVVEKSVVGEQVQRSEPRQHVAGLPPTGSEKTYIDDTEVVMEIRTQFERASDSAGEVSKMLEVGKMPYYQKSSGFKVSAMMICGIPTLDEFLRFEEDKAMGCGNLSSTLQKLYMWEKKLLEEVKTEEKMRVLYDRKREELKILDEKGAEAHKLEATEIYIRKLSTKISIAIQVVNTISDKISKLRDEELWPQTCELIQGLMQMWSIMLECHQIQLHAISQAKNIDSMIDAAKFGEAHMDLIKHLELQLLDWIACFAAWVNAQKSYVNTLNQWLMKGVIYVPEETDDGVPPFSPGRLGAPPIFVICNNWAASVGRISEKEVVQAMQAFASNVLNLWERHRSEQRQGLMANKGMDRDLRVMERDEQSMRKALEAQNKKLVLISNQSGVSLSAQVLHDGSPRAEIGSLQSSLKNIFEAMENFTAASANTYKDLHLRAEEEKARVAQEGGRVT